MRTGTMISLGASAMLGLGALIVAKVWLPSNHPTQYKSAQTAQATVPVVVAAADIPYGTKIDAHRLAVERLPVGTAPAGAYSDPAQILAQSGGAPIALTPIVAREPLLPSKLSGGGARPTVSAIISEGMRAYTIGVTDVAGGGGHVLPNDRVDVVLTRDRNETEGAGVGAGAVQGKRLVSNVVLQNVRVLGMDLNADPSSTQAAIAHTATLEVAVQDAQKLAVAAEAGSLSLALRRTGAAEVTPVRVIQVSDLGSVGPGARAGTPGGARLIAAHSRSKSKSPLLVRTRAIIVVHGDTSSSVEVPAERYGAGA
ncbi:MAG: Flp pilus assembly protein CpaB [Caulobacterales bacterium]